MYIKIPEEFLKFGERKLSADELFMYYYLKLNELKYIKSTVKTNLPLIFDQLKLKKQLKNNNEHIEMLLNSLKYKNAINFEGDKNKYAMEITFNEHEKCIEIDSTIYREIDEEIEETQKGNYFYIYCYLLKNQRKVSTSELASILEYSVSQIKRVIVPRYVGTEFFKRDRVGRGMLFLKDIHDDLNDETVKIYFIQDTMNKCIKIGITNNIKDRLDTLQTSSPYKLELLKCFDGNKKVERELHERFKEYRLSGEWFKYNEELMEYINIIL